MIRTRSVGQWNDPKRRTPGGSGRVRPIAVLAPLAIAVIAADLVVHGLVPVARAATNISPFATVSLEHDSNVFMRPASAPPLEAQGITALGDTIQQYEAGLTSEFDWGAERLRLDGDGTRALYDRFSFLDYSGYRFGGTLDWRASPVIDGSVSYDQHRYIAPFTQTLSTQLLLDTDRTAKATVRVLVTREWRLDLTPEFDQFDTPLPGYPDFRLRENVGTAGIDYLGFGRLTAGLRFHYSQGRYSGIAGATRYDQRESDLTTSYKLGGFSTFSANAGYTVRDTEANPAGDVANAGSGFAGYAGAIGRTSAFTGSLSYRRQLTAKTSAHLSLSRTLGSYAAGANPEVGTGGAVGLDWKADPKFTVAADYSLTREQIQGGLIVAGVTNRSDYARWGRVSIRYAALSWLAIRPYVIWQRQTSTFLLGNFSSTIVGIDFTSHLRW